MPISHGLHTRAGSDTIRADTAAQDRRDTAARTFQRAPTDDYTWPYYPMEQIGWLATRLTWPTVPAAVLDPTVALSDLPIDGHGGGLTVPYVAAVIGPKTAPADVVDRVWRYIATATRTHRGLWNLYALGLARRGLHQQAEKLTTKREPSVKRHMQHRLAAEFLIELHRTEGDAAEQEMFAFDIDKPYIFARLRDHCIYTVTKQRWRRDKRERDFLTMDGYTLLYEILPGGNTRSRMLHIPGRADAFSVLARLVAQAPINQTDAESPRPTLR